MNFKIKKITHTQKCAYIPIIGKSNVGKSTIFNKLIKKKISITSKKKHTTQQNIIGINTKKYNQYIFIDTPGFKNKYNFFIYIKKTINYIKKYFNINFINLIILVIETKINLKEITLINNIHKINIPILIIINKIDKIKNKSIILPYINKIKNNQKNIHIIPISAKKKTHINYIKNNFIKKYLTKQKHYFKSKIKTNCKNNFIISEIIREKIIRLIGDEIPYSIKIILEKIIFQNKKTNIFILILVKKKQHINIIIGKKGNKIKKIIYLSKKSILKYIKSTKKIKLFLNIKKKKNKK